MMRSACGMIALIVLAVAVSGCQTGDKADARTVVRDYAELLPSVYARSEPSLLSDVATPAEQNRVLMYLLYLKKENQSLDTRLLELDIESTEVLDDGERVTVETRERWEYRTVDASSGAGAPFIPVEYRSVYTLRRSDDRWLVSEVDVRETSDKPESR